MCNATALKAGLSGLKELDKTAHLKDAALGVGPLLAVREYARKTDPEERKFQDYATAYTQELRQAAIREAQSDLSYLKTKPTEAEYSKMIDDYSTFPDVKKQAFAKAFPEGITEKNQRLAAAVFEDAEPIPQLQDSNKYNRLNKGQAEKRYATPKDHREAMTDSPSAAAKLPQEMQGKGLEVDGGAWRYALSNAATRTMERDGIKYDPHGGEAFTKVIESYMTRKDVQREAYRNAYDPTNRGPARATDKAPSPLTAAVFADAPAVAAGGSEKATAGPADGTTAVEQEKQRRLAYWKQKAAEQLKIEATQGGAK